MIRTLLLVLGCLSFIVVVGGATYEHLCVVPPWTAAVPASLSMFQGEYALNPGAFWRPVHPIAFLLLVAALILNWRTGRRGFIVAGLLGYAAALAATFVYFVPELMAITGSAYSTAVDAELTRRANTWEFFSLIRLALIYLVALILLFGLSRPADRRDV